MINFDKTYKTKCGYEVKLVTYEENDGILGFNYVIVGLYFKNNKWHIAKWHDFDGKYSKFYSSKLDLVEIQNA